MPSSTVEIANLALLKLGSEEALLALTDNTTQGRVMNRLFVPVRDSELRLHNWKFAIARTSLVALAQAPAWGFQYQYQLPADFLRLVQVNDWYYRTGKQQTMWSVEGGKILTNIQAPLKLRYVRRVDNSGEFDPLFVQSMACRLAVEACEKITQSTTKKQELAAEYKLNLRAAVRCDAIENPPDELPWGSWLDSREGDASTLYYGDDTYPYLSGSQIL